MRRNGTRLRALQVLPLDAAVARHRPQRVGALRTATKFQPSTRPRSSVSFSTSSTRRVRTVRTFFTSVDCTMPQRYRPLTVDAADAKGEPIHQTLMAKKMQRLDESPDFRPFKFRIQAFTNAFLEEVSGRIHAHCADDNKYHWSSSLVKVIRRRRSQ